LEPWVKGTEEVYGIDKWIRFRWFKKKAVLPLLAFIYILYLPGLALAHTGLDSSNPKEGEIVTAELTKISLVYKSKVENLSSFLLFNKENQKIDILDLQINDTTMTGTLAQPAANGEYQVQWNIVGTDGHPIKGQFSFQVDRPAVDSAKIETPEPTPSKPGTDLKPEVTKVEAPAPTPPKPAAETMENTSWKTTGNSLLLYILIILVVLLGLTVFSLKKRRR
jgi:methionine-rich copper-binding protein CopC